MTVPGGSATRAIRADFCGDGVYQPSQCSSVLQVISGETSTSTVPRTGYITTSVTLRGYLKRTFDNASLDGRTIGFQIDGTLVGSGVTGATGTSGRADLVWVITDGPASREIKAEFAGDGSYDPSFGTATLTAQTAATKMYVPDRTQRIADGITLKAYLYRDADSVPVAGKMIRFLIDGTQVGSGMTNDTARAKLDWLVPEGAGAGTRAITCFWDGDAGFLAVSRSATLTVTRAPVYLFAYARSAALGMPATLKAYLRRLPDYAKLGGRTVDFSLEGTPVGSAVTGADGWAELSGVPTAGLAAGYHPFTAAFAGDAGHLAGVGNGTLKVL
jgi:hypothetical protein